MRNNGIKNRYKLSDREVNIIDALYMFRGLTKIQIWQLFFKKAELSEENNGSEYCRKILSSLKSKGFVEAVKYRNCDKLYFLTASGVSAAIAGFSEEAIKRRPFLVPTSINNTYTASQLKFDGPIAAHQIALNDFIISLSCSKYPIKWIYYHEKLAARYFKNARPDGILEIEDTIFFLEQDMSTENIRKLQARFEFYRSFKNSQEAFNKKIVVLFIINSINVPLRASLMIKILQSQLGDKISDNFNFYFGSLEEISDLVNTHMKELCGDTYADVLFSFNSIGFKCDKDVPESLFGEVKFDYYARRLNENGKILNENGHLQEFIVDDYCHNSQVVLSKIRNYDILNNKFKNKHGRDIIYLVIVKSIPDIYRDLKNCNLLNCTNVAFTTLDFITKNAPINENIFTFDSLENVFCFENTSYNSVKKIGVISDYKNF